MEGGGAERVASILCNRWASIGHDVTLMPTFSGRGECNYPLDRRVTLEYLADLAASRGKGLAKRVRRFFELRRFLKDQNPDVVVSFLARVNIAAIVSTVGLRSRLVLSERNNPARDSVGRPVRLLRRVVYQFADVVVAQTNDAAKWISRYCIRTNVCIIPNPVVYPIANEDPRVAPEDWLDKDHKLILAAGRLVRQKNFACLIEAFSGIAGRCPGWRLVIIGEGGLRADLESKIRRCELGDTVHLPGRVGNVGEWYERADIYVLSSLFEGFPNTLLEAMAYGVPAVSFDCEAGPRDIIKNDVNGVLIPETEGADGLAEALVKLMQDPKTRERFREAAPEVREKYSVESVEKEWSRLICAEENESR